MIQVTILDTVAEIMISGKGEEFYTDLARIKREIDTAHRFYEDFKKVWVIHNYRDLMHLPYIKKAVEQRDLQEPLL